MLAKKKLKGLKAKKKQKETSWYKKLNKTEPCWTKDHGEYQHHACEQCRDQESPSRSASIGSNSKLQIEQVSTFSALKYAKIKLRNPSNKIRTRAANAYSSVLKQRKSQTRRSKQQRQQSCGYHWARAGSIYIVKSTF